jgi:peptide/nickel transport system permease protein
MSALWSIPMVLMVIALLATMGHGIGELIFSISLVQWVIYARIVRGEVIALKTRQFVEASLALGASPLQILSAHIIPNTLAPVIVTAVFTTIDIVALESGLSFLGLGVPPPDPSLGQLIKEGIDFIGSAWWLAFFPGLLLVAIIFAVNEAGRSLEEKYGARAI